MNVPGVVVDGEIDAVVAPVDQEYVYGPVPPLGFAVSVAVPFAQTDVVPVMLTVGRGKTTTVPVVFVDPDEFVNRARY